MYNQIFRPPSREDMLHAPVRPLILRIALPSLCAMLATGICTLLDALLLSRQAGHVSAAASVCFPLIATQQAAGFTLGMGAGSHVSRAIGEGDFESARQVAADALLFALITGSMLLIAGYALLTPLLTTLGADEYVLPHAAAYAKPLLLSSPLACTQLVLSSLLRAQGRTELNMLAYLLSSAAGIALDFVLIPRLGTRGAGISLLAREALAFLLLALMTLRTKELMRPDLRDITLKKWIAPAILHSGLPTLLRQGAMSLSGAMLSRAAAAIGPAALSGMGIAARALALITSAAIGFGQGFSPVCGVSYGAGSTQRIQEAYRFSMRVLAAALLVTGALVFLFADRLLALFGADAQAAAFAVRVLQAQSPVLFCQGAVILMNILTQSCGRMLPAVLVATSRQGIFLIPFAFILPRLFGETGLIFCQSASDVMALGFSMLIVKIDRRKHRY